MKGKRRMIVFLGSTGIEIAIACFLGIEFIDSIWIILLGNFLSTLFVDYVYKKK